MRGMIEILKSLLQSGSVWAVCVAFCIGLFVGFTPCIYPILPITIAYIGRISGGKRFSGLLYSLVYVFGMALVYCTVGVITVLAGGQLGQLWSNG